jgi:hypothetical protein
MKQKLRPLGLFFAVSFLVPLGEAAILRRVEPFGSAALIQGVLSAIAVYWWYYLDRRERQFRTGAFQNMAVAVIGLIGLPVYLFRSRGLGRGALATGLAFVALIVSGLLSYAGELAGYKIAP